VEESLDRAIADLRERAPAIRASWNRALPFPYVVIDDFAPADLVTRLEEQFPRWDVDGWDDTEYVHQRRKLTRTHDFPHDLDAFFALLESPAFLGLVTELTGIEGLIQDPTRVGGGCHQILSGGYLDVHVDFNRHPETSLRRRLNLLLYLNRDWDPVWGGQLELWDMEAGRAVEVVDPIFNRAVLFETGESSYHGHPSPLRCPEGRSRKSLAAYYYTHDDPDGGPEHNTIYVQTTGAKGYLKTAQAAVLTARRHLAERGVSGLGKRVLSQAIRVARRQPPPND
jgi:Rps23 Pro-64 3,4-dihydroxylase Tpa1-like proline 4-hydroxylase